MFEKLKTRVGVLAEETARGQAAGLASRIEAALPPDVAVRAEGADVVLSGRGLRRRFVTDERFKWLMAEIVR